MRIDVYHHTIQIREIEWKLEKILQILRDIQVQEKQMSVELDALTLEVEEIGTVVDSAVAFIQGIAAQLEAIKEDPVKIQALADTLDGTALKLADAIVANTPVEPPLPE